MADDRRQQLADEARALLREVLSNTQGHPWHVADAAVDVLLPLLDRVAANAAAEALEDAATCAMNGSGGRPINWLRARAAELRAPARTDEEN